MPGHYYVKDFGETRFIVLDSEKISLADEQGPWLRRVLEKSDKKFNFVVFHHPPATISYRHGWRERENFQLKIRNTLLKYQHKITAIINGHDHLATMFTYDQIPVIVSGAVFESRPAPAFNYNLDNKIPIKTQWVNDEGFYWVRLDVDEQREAVWVNFIRTDIHEVSCSILIYQNKTYRKKNCYKNNIDKDVVRKEPELLTVDQH